MRRIHIDDLQNRMTLDHFVYLRRWLEQHHALIVVPGLISVPHRSMGSFDRHLGRWGVDEPYPLYTQERQLFEEARADGGCGYRAYDR